MDPYLATLNELFTTTYRSVLKVEEVMLRHLSNNSLTLSEMHMLECIGKRKGDAAITDIAQELDITPPSMKSSESVSKNKPATVSVTKDGKFFWNSDEISESSLEAKIKDLSKSPTPELIVLGDKESSLQNVMKVVDFARLAKIKKLSLQSLSQ